MAKTPRDNRRKVMKEQKEFDEELLDLARVTRVVRGGRRLRFRATVAVGNKKGKVGLGTGKSAEVAVAVQKAVAAAKRNLIEVKLTEENSIIHEIEKKFKSARLLIMPASEGTGVKAGGVSRKIFELAGIHNILAKRFGSTTPLVNAQATIMALSEIQSRPEKKVVKQEEAVAEEAPAKKTTKKAAK